ncbi:MAG: aminoacyl-tRNA hydrolase [bacterium]
MKLILGLGNPEDKHINNRHNAGFIVLDEISKKLEFPNFENNKKFEAQLCEKNIAGEKIILAKPQTFMNLSGKSALAISTFYKIPIEDLIIIHDELDIDLGNFKISEDSSAGGHNGVTSIFETFGSQKIKRIRIGIEGAQKKLTRKIPGSDFVLQDFSQEEIDVIKNLAEKIIPQIQK